MVLPLALLNTAKETPVLVEIKNGSNYNGHLSKIDSFMNIVLRNVIFTDKDGQNFMSLREVYIRGNTIRCFRLNEDLLEKAIESGNKRKFNKAFGRGRGRGRGAKNRNN